MLTAFGNPRARRACCRRWPSAGRPGRRRPAGQRRAGGVVHPGCRDRHHARNRGPPLRGYGHDANDVPVTENSRFRIASLSKSFTSLAVLQLVDAGRVSLDDPVVAHLPEFRLADPRGADITVRQLLDQTSGLADREVPDLSRPQPSTLAEATTSLSSAHLVAAPGTQFNYHNPNYQVAARLVEVVSGQPFDTYLREHVFRPAGMAASLTSYFDNQPVPGLADGHVIAYGHPISVPAPATFDGGAGDVVSTAADMAHWLVVQANGGRTADGTRLVSERSMTEMHTPSAPGGYALGWDTEGPAAAPTRLEHSGNLLTFSAYQAVLPQSGYGIAVLFNSGSPFLRDQTAIFHGVLASRRRHRPHAQPAARDHRRPRRPPGMPHRPRSGPRRPWRSRLSPLGDQTRTLSECVSGWACFRPWRSSASSSPSPTSRGVWRAAATSAGSRRRTAGPPWSCLLRRL